MRIDIRLPLGLLFLILGLMLFIFGLTSDPSLYQRSLGININEIAGAGQGFFGGLVLFFGARAELRKSGKNMDSGDFDGTSRSQES